MTTVTCTRCPIQAEIRRTGPNSHRTEYDLPGMVDRCVVLAGELASKGTLSLGDVPPECPHLDAAIRTAVERGRR